MENLAEFAGKNRSGQCSQLALTSTSTLLVGTTIWSCLVGRGGFLYWRRAFWICCLTSSRAASSVASWVVIFGKSGTWAVQPSGDKVQSTGYEKHKIRMTQMTLMTLNPGYGIGISSKQRHKRHQRHYRHTRAARGVGVHPGNAFVDIQTLCLQNTPVPSQNVRNQTGQPYKFV